MPKHERRLTQYSTETVTPWPIEACERPELG